MHAARGAGADDIDDVVALARRLRAEVATQRGGELWLRRHARPEPLESTYATLICSDDAHLVVGTRGESIVGFGVAEIAPLAGGGTLGRITDLYIEPEARRAGVGEAVLSLLTAFCARRGCSGIDALALPGSREAKSFFETSGFTARLLVMHRSDVPETPEAR